MRTEEEIKELIDKLENSDISTPITKNYILSLISLLEWVLSSKEEDIEKVINHIKMEIALQEIEENKKREIECLNKLRSPGPVIIFPKSEIHGT